jgi:hypothetical protein
MEHIFGLWIQKYEKKNVKNPAAETYKLSLHMQMQKLEDEMNSKIFAWSRKNLSQLLKLDMKGLESSI